MTETQERFLRTVLSRVPLDRVVELHLFPPIRRGTLETGVAVIATLLPPIPVALVADGVEEDAAAAALDAQTDEAPAMSADVAAVAPSGADLGADAEAFVVVEPTALDVAEGVVELGAADPPEGVSDLAEMDDTEPVVDLGAVEEAAAVVEQQGSVKFSGGREADVDPASDESPYRDDEVEPVNADLSAEADEAVSESSAPVVAASPRMRILTAAYRHTIKGIDRGKWSVDVQEEADAPLDAVEAVLRGVRHRSTEPADPEQVSLEGLGALLSLASPHAAPAAA